MSDTFYKTIIVIILASLAALTILGWQQFRQVAALQDLLVKQQDLIQNLQLSITDTNKKISRTSPPPPPPATNTPSANPDELLTQAVAKVAPAVVSIVISKDVPLLEIDYVNPFGNDPFFHDFGIRIPVYRQKGFTEKKVGAGTGFIINSNGYIVTNRHVVSDPQAKYTVLLSDGNQKQAQVIYIDEKWDIAVLKIDGGNYPYVKLGNSDKLKLGQTVLAIGNALGEYSNSVSVGIISGLNRTIEAAGNGQVERLEGVIQTDAAINPGNSGGPLVDLQGEVIGVNVATVRGSENIGFAIPINIVKQILAREKFF